MIPETVWTTGNGARSAFVRPVFELGRDTWRRRGRDGDCCWAEPDDPEGSGTQRIGQSLDGRAQDSLYNQHKCAFKKPQRKDRRHGN